MLPKRIFIGRVVYFVSHSCFRKYFCPAKQLHWVKCTETNTCLVFFFLIYVLGLADASGATYPGNVRNCAEGDGLTGSGDVNDSASKEEEPPEQLRGLKNRVRAYIKREGSLHARGDTKAQKRWSVNHTDAHMHTHTKQTKGTAGSSGAIRHRHTNRTSLADDTFGVVFCSAPVSRFLFCYAARRV